MRIIEIAALENGAHRNQTSNMSVIPDGWAVIPETMETPNFPFGTVTAEEINGVMTVTDWTPGRSLNQRRSRNRRPPRSASQRWRRRTSS